MVAFSDCKINIGLDIVAKRPDGYHDIETVMVHVPWRDIIEVIPSEANSTLTVLGNKVNCDVESNLVMKAFRLLQRHYALPEVEIVLQKCIPDGAGLGGGSADASSTILLLNDLFGLGLTKEKMAEYAAILGADCPFFIFDTPMYAYGTGTNLEPISLDLSGLCLLIAKPQGVNISTKQAYAGVKPHRPEESLKELIRCDIHEWMGRVKNDFEPSIFALAPQIKAVKDAMLREGALYASMSGSGASVYGFFDSEYAALKLQKENFSNYQSFICRF